MLAVELKNLSKKDPSTENDKESQRGKENVMNEMETNLSNTTKEQNIAFGS